MNRSSLADATSSDDSPVPGYLLNEISRATVTSYPTSVEIQDYLISRLAKSNPNIKYKSLVVIKHICRTGRVDFKKDIAKHVDAIKECLQFRGPPDPLRGDEYYRRVREAAKEAIESIFDGQVPVSTSAVAAANRIQGIGGGEIEPSKPSSSSTSTSFLSSVTSTFSNIMSESDSGYVGHPGAMGPLGGPASSGAGHTAEVPPSTSSFTGIGNPNFKDPRDEKSWYQRATEAASKTFQGDRRGGLMEDDYSKTFTTNRGAGAYGLGDASYIQPAPTSNAIVSNAGLNPTFGPGIVPDFPTNPGGVGRVGSAAADGSYERAMVQSLCEPSGLKPVPPEDILKQFLTAVHTLSPEVVGSCLADVLNSDAWQSRVKALIVIAGIARTNDSHKTWWIENGSEDLSALASGDGKVAVRTQAGKTLAALGLAAGVASSPSPSQPKTDILSFIDADEPAPAAPVSDMFAGLSVSPKVQSPPVVSTFDFLGGSDAPPTGAPPPAPAVTASAPTPAGKTNIVDAFDFLNSPAITPTAPPPVVDIFSQLSLGSAPPQYPSPAYPAYPLPSQFQPQPPQMQMYPRPGLATGVMNINLATRKEIPTASNGNNSIGSSGFSFLASEGGGHKPAADSFGFITEALQAEKSKK